MQVQCLGLEDALEEGTATHFGTLAWRIPLTEESVRLQSIGLQRIGHNWSDLASMHAMTREVLRRPGSCAIAMRVGCLGSHIRVSWITGWESLLCYCSLGPELGPSAALTLQDSDGARTVGKSRTQVLGTKPRQQRLQQGWLQFRG